MCPRYLTINQESKRRRLIGLHYVGRKGGIIVGLLQNALVWEKVEHAIQDAVLNVTRNELLEPLSETYQGDGLYILYVKLIL